MSSGRPTSRRGERTPSALGEIVRPPSQQQMRRERSAPEEDEDCGPQLTPHETEPRSGGGRFTGAPSSSSSSSLPAAGRPTSSASASRLASVAGQPVPSVPLHALRASPNGGLSPRKRPTTSDSSASFGTSGLHYGVPPPKTASPSSGGGGSVASPLSQRFGRYGAPMTPSPSSARPMTSDRAPSSGGKSLYDLTSRLTLSGSKQPVRAAHSLGPSSSASHMDTAASATAAAVGHAANHHARSSSNFNIWSRDTSANKVDAAAHGTISAAAAPRPSSSRSAHRPVTARADLFSARDEMPTRDDMPAPYTSAYGEFGSHTTRVGTSTKSKTRPAASTSSVSASDRMAQTAFVSSSGAQARARSAHVLCRPPSRQRPPNQALHLSDASSEFPMPAGVASSSTTTRPTRHGWSTPSQPVVDLFPAAPLEVVRAGQAASRVQTADPSAGGRAKFSSGSSAFHATTPNLAYLHLHSARSELSSEGDTEDTDTTSVGTDLDDGGVTEDDGGSALRGDDSGFGFDAHTAASASSLQSPGSFVSLHNILQLQSTGTSAKKRVGSASKRASGGKVRDADRPTHDDHDDDDLQQAEEAAVQVQHSSLHQNRPVSRRTTSAVRRQVYE